MSSACCTFFDNYGVKEAELHLHADNCAGQNKNNAMPQYLLWRPNMGGIRRLLCPSLLLATPNFHQIKHLGCSSGDFAEQRLTVWKTSSTLQKNAPPRMSSSHSCGTEYGSVVVTTHDWTKFLDKWYRKFLGLKKYHHFELFPSGEAHARLTRSSDRQVIKLLKGLPPIITSMGLSEQRQQYLFNEKSSQLPHLL